MGGKYHEGQVYAGAGKQGAQDHQVELGKPEQFLECMACPFQMFGVCFCYILNGKIVAVGGKTHLAGFVPQRKIGNGHDDYQQSGKYEGILPIAANHDLRQHGGHQTAADARRHGDDTQHQTLVLLKPTFYDAYHTSGGTHTAGKTHQTAGNGEHSEGFGKCHDDQRSCTQEQAENGRFSVTKMVKQITGAQSADKAENRTGGN